jgi:hypothetical protein
VYGPLSSVLAVATADTSMEVIGNYQIIKADGTVRVPGDTS